MGPALKGTVDRHLIEKMKLLAANPVELYRGSHVCEVCAVPGDVVKTVVPDRGKLMIPSAYGCIGQNNAVVTARSE